MKKYRRLEDKPKLLLVTIIKGIKQILKFITSEEFNQQAMIFKLDRIAIDLLLIIGIGTLLYIYLS